MGKARDKIVRQLALFIDADDNPHFAGMDPGIEHARWVGQHAHLLHGHAGIFTGSFQGGDAAHRQESQDRYEQRMGGTGLFHQVNRYNTLKGRIPSTSLGNHERAGSIRSPPAARIRRTRRCSSPAQGLLSPQAG